MEVTTRPVLEKIGNCSVCGKPSAWNSPGLDSDGNLYCDTCSTKSSRLIHGVKQHKQDGEYVFVDTWKKQGAILMGMNAWVDEGISGWDLTADQKDTIKIGNPEAVLDLLLLFVAEGKRQCLGCHKIILKSEIAGRPLFAGVACADCWKKHQEKIEHERRTGNCCRICGSPRSACCC